ncbi:MAG: PIN domain-containing protein [Thiobacillus sp.]|nr:PIN domain-containing protein [Thiobacillus sp.]
MTVKVFVDSNIAIYLYSGDEPDRRTVAESLMRAHERPWVSTQVLSELANVLRRKFKLDYEAISEVVKEVGSACAVHLVTQATIAHALRLGVRYGYSYYDSLILAAALECGAETLVSEDMQHDQVIESRLLIKNPFA